MRDQLHRPIHLEKTPQRIISLVPSQTELLVDLGLEHAIVGITKFCVHPNRLLKEKAIVGGTKSVHLDAIKALAPDIILCNKEENTKEMIAALVKIAPLHISDVNSLEDALELIAHYGKLFSTEAPAAKMIEGIKDARADLSHVLKNQSKRSAAYFIWKNPWMVAASGTFIDKMLQESGFQNHFGHLERYPEIDLQDALQLEAPDLIFLSTEPFPFKEEHKTIIQTYYPKATIVFVDGEMFSWYGSRLLKAFEYFKTLHQYPSH